MTYRRDRRKPFRLKAQRTTEREVAHSWFPPCLIHLLGNFLLLLREQHALGGMPEGRNARRSVIARRFLPKQSPSRGWGIASLRAQ